MFRILSRTALAVVLVATSSLASSQVTESNSKEQDAAAEPAPPPAQPTFIQLPALAPVELMVLEPVTSKTALPGSPVRLALARPLYLTSELGLPAGTPVEGFVIHAAKGGMGGKSGELLLGARRIVLSETVTIPLRSFKLGPAKGQNNEAIAFGAAVAGGAVGAVASMFIIGGSAEVPARAWANAKTSADTEIPVTLLSKLPATPSSTIVPENPTAEEVAPTQPISTQGEIK